MIGGEAVLACNERGKLPIPKAYGRGRMSELSGLDRRKKTKGEIKKGGTQKKKAASEEIEKRSVSDAGKKDITISSEVKSGVEKELAPLKESYSSRLRWKFLKQRNNREWKPDAHLWHRGENNPASRWGPGGLYVCRYLLRTSNKGNT